MLTRIMARRCRRARPSTFTGEPPTRPEDWQPAQSSPWKQVASSVWEQDRPDHNNTPDT